MSHANAPLFGVAASFADERQVMEAIAALRPRGLGRIEVYSPVPIPGLAEALGIRTGVLPAVALAGAVLGLLGFLGMSIFAMTTGYRFIIGNRPPGNWAQYMIPSTSFGMLVGALAVTLGMLYLSRLPRLNHPAFNIVGFERATADRFFLTIEPVEDEFDPSAVESVLRAIRPAPSSVQIVPR